MAWSGAARLGLHPLCTVALQGRAATDSAEAGDRTVTVLSRRRSSAQVGCSVLHLRHARCARFCLSCFPSSGWLRGWHARVLAGALLNNRSHPVPKHCAALRCQVLRAATHTPYLVGWLQANAPTMRGLLTSIRDRLRSTDAIPVCEAFYLGAGGDGRWWVVVVVVVDDLAGL